MAHRCVRKLRLAKPSVFAHVRHFHPTTSPRDALAAPGADSPPAASGPSTSPREKPFDAQFNRKAAELRNLLSLKSPSPHRVWASYVELLHFCGPTRVPREIHQGVLRKCVPSGKHLRAVSAKLFKEGHKFKDDALYEARFRDVIRNLRASGETPSLDDYHCVLERFAALGNYQSAMMVLDEITQVGLAKEPETYGLCLQALSYRLTQPIWHLTRPLLVDEITRHCMKILEEMSVNGVPYHPRNVDYAFWILKETMNMEGFTALMKGAYGIDLAYPDRSPLEFWDKKEGPSSATESQPVRLPTRLPFSLSAFHTALDYLGRAGDMSKMVQLFEVVTNPLPSATSNSSFDDDDDDDFGYSNPQVAPYSPPHIRPNTTTFHIMLRHIHRARNEVLARHYMLVALEADRDQGRSLRSRTETEPPDQLPAPRISITRNMLLSVASVANDNKDVELLRWVLEKTKFVMKRKRFDLAHYGQVRAQWIKEGLHQPPALTDAAVEGSEEELPLGPKSSLFSTFFSPSSSHVYAGSPPNLSTASDDAKPFDIDLHLSLLRRDLDELVPFQRRLEHVLARTVQRVKERLGRRVWAEKNIFLRDTDRRLQVSKEFWRQNVNYRQPGQTKTQRAVPSPTRQTPLGEPLPAPDRVPACEEPHDSQVAPSSSPSASPSKSSQES
ncbi:hypothetical protein BV20DRAFT_995493 [Pilatotrama ljubarskyi]|nr:hypothetical protein BV20DRAFT_995493 [Pilatotrama ljubarskyi]